jgi:hypothetical protein
MSSLGVKLDEAKILSTGSSEMEVKARDHYLWNSFEENDGRLPCSAGKIEADSTETFKHFAKSFITRFRRFFYSFIFNH